MKLIKLNTDHYVVVNDSEIKEGDLCYDPEGSPGHNGIKYVVKCLRTAPDSYWNKHCKKITHSTQPFEQYYAATDGTIPFVYHKIIQLPLSKVKELLGEVDVDKKAEYDWMLHTEGSIVVTDKNDWKSGFHHGYNQAIEDNKEKKWTEEDMKYMFECGRNYQNNAEITFKVSMEYLQQSKTEWEVEFINGKLTLKQ